MNIFESIRKYAGKWELTNSRSFTQEEMDAVSSASVVSSEYGNSACFMMVGGGMSFIPMSSNSTVGVGESIDLSKAKLLTLERDGETINRVEI